MPTSNEHTRSQRRGAANSSVPARALVAAVLVLAGCAHHSAYIGGDPVDLDQETITPSSISERLILVGDAGVPDPEVIDLVTTWAAEAADRAMVVYLGDNVYPAGIPERGADGHDDAIRAIDTQLRPMLETGCRGLFIPGNHDWGIAGENGLERLRRQSDYVEAVLGADGFAPDPGCPGPDTIRLGGFQLVAIDTEWWLRDGNRPPDGMSCPSSPADAETLLRTELENLPAGAIAIVLGHHPLATRGRHGGFYEWKDHVFPLRNLHPALWVPLPVVGSLYPFTRSVLLKSDQDLMGGGNRRMRDGLVDVLTHTRPFVYASGHDHNLQIMVAKPWAAFTIVSGAGSRQERITPVGHDPLSWFAHSARGFVVLDRLAGGALIMRVVEVATDRADGVVSGWWIR